MAGEPKPWVIMEKWVRCLWMLGSRIGWGLVLHRGDLSWFNRSINSLQIILDEGEVIQLKGKRSVVNSLGGQHKLFPSVLIRGIPGAEILGDSFCGELCLADVSKVSRKVDCLSCTALF